MGATGEIVGGSFSGNSADSGGALSNHGPMLLSGVQVVSNSAIGYGGGILYSSNWADPLIIEDSWVSGNSAPIAGGIFSQGTLTITRSTVSSNYTSSYGGGLYLSLLSGPTQTISQSAFYENETDGSAGGGILTDAGTLAVANSTFYDNRAPNGEGGGLFIGQSADLQLSHVSVLNNLAQVGGGFYADTGRSGRVELDDTILAYNSASSSTGGPDCDGQYDAPASLGFNILSNTLNCYWVPVPGRPDFIAVDPMLGPWTVSGMAGSGHRLPLAAGLIEQADAYGGDCTGRDQLGVLRTVPCDRGAVEGP